MSDALKGSPVLSGSDRETARNELEYMAYEGQHTAVYESYKSMAEDDRAACRSVHVLNSVIRGGIARLNKSEEAWDPAAAPVIDSALSDGEHDLEQFIRYCTGLNIRPRQLYECILDWSGELADRSKTGDALHLLERAESLNLRTHPDLYARLILKRAQILFSTGRLREAHQALSVMAERYYLITDRAVISAIFALLGQTSLLTGQAQYFRNLLFENLRSAFTSGHIRRHCTSLLIKKIYVRSYRALLERELRFSDKVLFMAHVGYHAIHNLLTRRMSRLDRVAEFVPLTVAYLNKTMRHYRSPKRPAEAEDRGVSRRAGMRKTILVTRAMGGVGDLLMMTPGLHALKKKHPDHEIHLAIPRQFKPLFAGNTDIVILDIENEDLDVRSCVKWYNFTDIPEAFVESRTLPNVKKNRIEIFARALGVRGRRLRKMDSRPLYFVTAEEKTFQQKFWKDRNLENVPVIGVQLKSAEPYRDYPSITALILKLAEEFQVILFHNEKTSIAIGGNIIDPGTRSLREAFALAAACDALIAPDSAFVHLAGALTIPCVALYGPIDGKIRTMDYPSCIYLDARNVLQCVPCWRNEIIPCKLTDKKSSACMGIITVDEIYTNLKKIIGERP